MSFMITRMLEQVPSYQMLSNLAEQNQVRLTGNERNGSFSCRGMEGHYEFGAGGNQGKFAGHGVTGEFCFEIGSVTLRERYPKRLSLVTGMGCWAKCTAKSRA